MDYKNRNKTNVWVGLEEKELKLYNDIDKSLARPNMKKKKTQLKSEMKKQTYFIDIIRIIREQYKQLYGKNMIIQIK